MLITDNGVCLKYFNKVHGISIPKLNLSYYLIQRLLNNNRKIGQDIIACLKLDNNELYNEIAVGEKCSHLTKEKNILY